MPVSKDKNVLGMFSFRNSDRILKGVHIAMLILFILLTVYIISFNPESRFKIMGFCALFLCLSLIRHFILPRFRENILHWIFPYLEGAVIVYINYIDVTQSTLSLYPLLTMDVAIDYTFSYGAVFMFPAYIMYMIYYNNYVIPDVSFGMRILAFSVAAFQFFLYVGFALLTRRFSFQSTKLQSTTNELHAKLITLEQMTLLKERNRIAASIHNTVGHQLTTALVQIEAARMIISKDPVSVEKRLDTIREQIKDGLNELRRSVHAINADDEFKNFDQALLKLFEQTRMHAGITIEYEMADMSGLKLDLKRIIYNTVLESITNAIRHSKCDRIRIGIDIADGGLILSVYNNKANAQEINFGFGLSQIEKSIKGAGGLLDVRFNDSGWFGLIAKIPLEYTKGDI